MDNTKKEFIARKIAEFQQSRPQEEPTPAVDDMPDEPLLDEDNIAHSDDDPEDPATIRFEVVRLQCH